MRSKLLLIGIGIVAVAGLVLLAFQFWILGGILTALGLGLAYLWWRLSRILQISEAIVKDDIPLARQRLAAIRNPAKLNQYSQTYYYYFTGIVEFRSNNMKGAREGFKKALDIGYFRTPDEKAQSLMMMAQLDLRSRHRGNREAARRYIKEARDLEPGPQIKEQIELMVKEARKLGIRL